MSEITIGTRVRAVNDIYQPADEYAPGGYLAMKGEELIVREVMSDQDHFKFYVSHEKETAASFGVKHNEIEAA